MNNDIVGIEAETHITAIQLNFCTHYIRADYNREKNKEQSLDITRGCRKVSEVLRFGMKLRKKPDHSCKNG